MYITFSTYLLYAPSAGRRHGLCNGTVASDRKSTFRGQVELKVLRAEPGGFFGRGGIAVSPHPQLWVGGALYKLPSAAIRSPGRQDFWCMLDSSGELAPAVLACKTVCKQLVDFTNRHLLLRGEKTLSPRRFAHCGGERPRFALRSRRICNRIVLRLSARIKRRMTYCLWCPERHKKFWVASAVSTYCRLLTYGWQLGLVGLHNVAVTSCDTRYSVNSAASAVTRCCILG